MTAGGLPPPLYHDVNFMHLAITHNHPSVCQWLHTGAFDLVRTSRLLMLRNAAYHGHLDICVWLKRAFVLKSCDIWDSYNPKSHPLYIAVTRDKTNICKWLWAAFDDLDRNESLRDACINASVRAKNAMMCKLLMRHYGMIYTDDAGKLQSKQVGLV
jgi:hypothetical protein